MQYKELTIRLTPRDPYADILMAFLGEVGFESFVETDDGFLAYIELDNYPDFIDWPDIIKDQKVKLEYSEADIAEQNWNTQWESNFQPVLIEDKCYVRATFHPEEKKHPYEIVIDPKMSFGTAHHETTYMMAALIMKYPMAGCSVLDMGSGTGILAILAEKRGAENVLAVDNDPWSFENAGENIANNSCRHIEALLGNAESISGKSFDIILANINRNILLADMASYAETLKPGGLLFLSGFYTEDIEFILPAAEKSGMYLLEKMERNRWTALVIKKSGPVK